MLIPPPILLGVAQRGEGDDMHFYGQTLKPLAVGITNPAARKNLGDDGDGFGLVFKAPGPGGGDFIPGAGHFLSEADNGLARDLEPVEDGEADFVIRRTERHRHGGVYLGFKDRETFSTSGVIQFRRPERTGVKIAAGNEDEVNVFEVSGINDPKRGSPGEEGTVEKAEEDDNCRKGAEA